MTTIAIATLLFTCLSSREGQGQEDKTCLIQQVGDDAYANKSSVRDDVPSRDRRVAGNVHLGFHKAFGKAAEDADEQVEDAGDSRESLW
jgi:hypothetical protein